uniref:O14I1 protein n=1 Tax=Dromaius novaehollandiae TaxID=8790 RepID=A0A8C4J7S2_DRONO
MVNQCEDRVHLLGTETSRKDQVSPWLHFTISLPGQRRGERRCRGTWKSVMGFTRRSLAPNRQQMSNSSSLTEFLLLGFADTRELQLLHFSLFLGIYLAALLGNGLIITAVACDHRLHTPMYFFLLDLSILDLGSTTVIAPKSMANSLWDTRAISYSGCAAQIFSFVFFVSAEWEPQCPSLLHCKREPPRGALPALPKELLSLHQPWQSRG